MLEHHRRITPVPELRDGIRCGRCHGTGDLIAGEGVVVCGHCVRVLGEIAADPKVASTRMRALLAESHGDVVRLDRGDPLADILVWEWTADWPAAEKEYPE